MRIKPNRDGTLSVEVRLTRTKVAVFDARSISEAITGMVECVAQHCAKTGEHPRNIINNEIIYE